MHRSLFFFSYYYDYFRCFGVFLSFVLCTMTKCLISMFALLIDVGVEINFNFAMPCADL